MRIIDTMRKASAVYWPVLKDDLGQIIADNKGPLLDEPIELKPPNTGTFPFGGVFWMAQVEEIAATGGQQRQSKARVFTGIDIDIGGVMWQGVIGDIPAGMIDKPRSIPGAAEVLRFDKCATIKGDQWVRTAYL